MRQCTEPTCKVFLKSRFLVPSLPVPCALLNMYLKIFFDDKPLLLCDKLDETILPFIHHDDTIFIDELNTHTIKTIIHEMQLPQVHAGVFYHKDLNALKKAFWKKFSLVKAAGGLVINEKNEILLIFRRGKWDLPKGKLNKGEKLEVCALREVEEETGLQNTRLEKQLTISYHTYQEGARLKLKETSWYIMRSEGKQEISPQIEEDIELVKWVKQSEIKKYLNKTYASVKDILLLALNLD